ncbi:MAG: hypothetical protein WDN30_10745 [Pararobbsia sp.]
MTSSRHTTRPALSRASLWWRCAAIAMTLAALAGAFAYTAGWLAAQGTAAQPSAGALLDQFEHNAGGASGIPQESCEGPLCKR